MEKTHTHTHIALDGVLAAITEIRKDVMNGNRVFADMQLNYLELTIKSIQREQLPVDAEMLASKTGTSWDDQFDQTMTDARTTIGTFFDDLKDIYEPKECNSKP